MSADNAGARANLRPAAIRGISRRDVVKGSVATAILSLSASTMMSLRKKNPLYVVLGDDSSGAFRFLLDFWSRRSGVEVVYESAGSNPPEQRHKMLEWVDGTDDRDYVADLFGLDVVHVPEFIANGHIVKLGRDLIAEANEAYGGDQPLRFDNFVGRTLTTCRSPAVADEGHYAVPLTANVGVLFRNAAVRPRSDIKTLRGLTAAENLTWTAQFPDKIPPELAGNGSEAMICNLLEHALALDDRIVDGDCRPVADPARWNAVFDKLRAAIGKGRLKRALDEEESSGTFNDLGADFMRNWPSSRVGGGRSPIPAEMIAFGGAVIGGQNLALNKNSERHVEALQLAIFLTSKDAQRVLALHGYVPTLKQLYDPQEDGLHRILPHLTTVGNSLAWGILRPRIPDYSTFSQTVSRDAIEALRAENPKRITAVQLAAWRNFFPN